MASQAPLETQQVEVRLGKLDQKTSDKLAVPGTLALAQNVEMVNTGRYQRRSGTSAVATVAGAIRVHGGEREELVGSIDTLYSDVDGAFQSRGSIAGFRGDFEVVNNTAFAQTSHDMCRVNGLDISVWQETGGIFYAVRDSVTGAYLVEEAAVDTLAQYITPQIIAVGTLALIVYKDTSINGIQCRRIDTATPAVLGARTQIGANMMSGLGGSTGFDTIVKPGSTTTICVCTHAVADAVQLAEFNVATLTTTATRSVALTQNNTGFRSICFLQGVSPDYVVMSAAADNAGASVGSNIKAFTVTAGLSANGTVRVIWSGPTLSVHAITNCTGFQDGSGTWHMLIDASSTTASNRSQVWYFTRTSGGVLAGPGILFGFLLQSPVFTFGGRNLVLYSGTVQSVAGPDSTLFLAVVQTGAILGRALAGLADDRMHDPSGSNVSGHLPHVTVNAADFLIPSTYFQTTTLRSACVVQFDQQPLARYLEVAGVTLIPGSSIYMYDGMGVTELGFHFPPGITALSTAATGGLQIGTYWFRACWEWLDARGRLAQSKPSDPVSLTVASNGLRGRVTVGTLVTTLKAAPIPQASLAIFRTTINPSSSSAAAYWRCATVTNDPTTASLIVDDTMTDATLITQDRLYTLGNTVLAYADPPPANALAAWGNRVWACERDLLWFSNEIQDRYGIQFPVENFIQVSDERGDVVTSADAGQRLAVFKRTAIYVVSGDGPDATGKGSFSPLRRLPAPLGARSAICVISTELGVFFQDDASGHIWLLPPQGDPEPIGREVETLSMALTITDAVVVSDKRQVRFYTQQGTTLCYDMTHQRWSWNDNQPAAGAALVGGLPNYLVVGTGEIREDDPAAWREGEGGASPTSYVAALETDDISVNQIAGYVRHFAAQATGKVFGSHLLTITLKYRFGTDNEARYVHSDVLTASFGYRAEARPKLSQQQATALRIRLEDDGSATAGFGLEVLTLTVGTRGKRGRLPPAHLATTTP
jgi:hypothetical protein